MSDTQSVEALRASMRAENDRRRGEINAAADEQINEIRKRTDDTIAGEREQAFAALEQELSAVRRRMRDEADLKSRRRLLEIENDVIDEAFRMATERLSSAERNDAYRSRLTHLAAHAARAVANRASADATITVRVPAELEHDAKNAVARALEELRADRTVETSVDPNGEPGMIVAATSDGARTVDNGVATRLHRSRTRLLPELGKVLFPGDEDEDGRG